MDTATPARFDGATYSHDRDGTRLAQQMGRVRRYMADGAWHTLAQLADATEAPEASVSARLRDLRKPRFGGYTVERRYVSAGLFEYRLTQPAASLSPDAAGTSHDRDGVGQPLAVQPSAPAASKPGAEGAPWSCVDCHSTPASEVEDRLGGMGWAYCRTCEGRRYFRRRAAA